MQTIENFLLRYSEAVAECNFDEIVKRFHDFFILSTQDNVWYLKNNLDFKNNLAKSFEVYKNLGSAYCKMIDNDIQLFASDHAIATIRWGLFDSLNQLILKFEITYCLKIFDREWKYVFVMDHDEEKNIREYLK